MSRRIRNEIKALINEGYLVKEEYNDKGFIFSITIKKNKLTIILRSIMEYPFQPPKVHLLNGDSYLNSINFISSQLPLIKNKEKCLCCKSILCDWTLIRTIMDIFREVEKNYEILIKIKNSILCKKICKRHLQEIVGIELLICSFLYS